MSDSMSANSSYENLNIYTTQMNPNLSTTNLQNLHKFEQSLPKQFISPLHSLNSSTISLNSTLRPYTPYHSLPTPPISINVNHIQHETVSNRKIMILCANWYLFSIISNYSTKLILQDFKYPITLTQFQFILNSALSIMLLVFLLHSRWLQQFTAAFPKYTLPDTTNLDIKQFIIPTKLILKTTVPMGCFQFVGHLTSHNATSIIPVSLNHTIKALSPLMTVVFYRLFFNSKYLMKTYLSLIPLILGIMLSCYKNNAKSIDNYFQGLFYSFVSMLIFVSQNIFAKNRLTVEAILPSHKCHEKLDKLTILFYCSIVGFIFTFPIYIISEFQRPYLTLWDLNIYNSWLILINGISHFAQSLLAFQILGLISPINYSIANILKRIIIILVAFVIEGKQLSYNQGFGIMLTCIGLFVYDRYGNEKH